MKAIFVIGVIFLAGVSAQEQGTNYNAGDHGRSETVSPDGEVQGQYHYTDADGKLITVKYRAGKDGFQVEGDHLPRAPVPQSAPQPQPQQPQYNPQQYQQPQPQYQPNFQNQQFQQQPQQNYFNPQPAPFQNPQQQQFFNTQPQQNSQFSNNQYQQPAPVQNQYFPQQQQQSFGHPNALPQNFYQQPQQYQGNQNNGQYRPTKVSVSQNPNSGFTYNIES